MNKEDYLKKIETFKLKSKTKKLLREQLNLFYDYKSEQNHNYKVGDTVKLSSNNLLHGTRANLETLEIISKNGLISTEFFNDFNSNKKKPYVIELWDIKENIELSEWIKKYAGVTIDFKNLKGETYKSIITSFENMKSVIQNETKFRDYIIYQNQEQRFVPNDIVNNESTVAFIVSYNKCNKLITNDIFDVNFDKKIVKDLLPKWFYKKYMINRNFDNYETGREKAILFGIPIGMFNGILVSRKYQDNNDYLNKLKELFPNCYICNLDGKVIK